MSTVSTTPPGGRAAITNECTVAVSCYVGIYVWHTCLQDCQVGDTQTRFYLSETDTAALLRVDDRALLILADTAARAASSMLFDWSQPVPGSADRRPVTEDREGDALRSPIRIDADVTITGACPMSFEVDSTGVRIIIVNPDTVCLTFDERSLLEFARLTSNAARIVHARLPPNFVKELNEPDS